MAEQRWYCVYEHHEDITAVVLAALKGKKTTVFRILPRQMRRKKAKRLQVRCSQGHLNIVRVEP